MLSDNSDTYTHYPAHLDISSQIYAGKNVQVCALRSVGVTVRIGTRIAKTVVLPVDPVIMPRPPPKR